MRKLIFAITTTLLAATCAAAATLPHAGVRFTGATSAKKINGFGDTVTFVVGTKSLKRFSFGTVGCFGYGNFPAGVDPYGISIAQLPIGVPMKSTGAFSITSALANFNEGDGSRMRVTVSGKFASATSVTGLISITETLQNGATCGPLKMTFTAKPGRLSASTS